MRKIISCILIVMLLVFISSCAKSVEINKITDAIVVEDIVEIKVSTQMTSSPKHIELERRYWESLLNKLDSFSLEQTDDEPANGWQYLFKIKQKGEMVTSISFMEHKVNIDTIVYTVKDYHSDDFLYLFE